jgi:uncharacterized protein (TIGR02452 family)
MYDRRERLIQVFEDTKTFIREEPTLAQKAAEARQATEFYPGEEYPQISAQPDKEGMIRVTRKKTFEAAKALHKEHKDWRIAVLNFASATTPGGGVTKGSSAQEESLCRCSTLYPALTSNALWDAYYSVNRAARNPLYTDALIYTPNVTICKTDVQFPERLEQSDWTEVDVITCAAPNLRQRPGNMYNHDDSEAVIISPDELLALHKSRARHILTVAASKGVDALILGAFGCGAFQNDPTVVAEAYKDVLEEMKGYFSLTEFAIYCRPRETANYDAFSRVLA